MKYSDDWLYNLEIGDIALALEEIHYFKRPKVLNYEQTLHVSSRYTDIFLMDIPNID